MAEQGAISQQHTPSAETDATLSAPTYKETKNDSGETIEHSGDKHGSSAEDKNKPHTKRASPGEDSTLDATRSTTPSEADENSHGDYNRETSENEESAMNDEDSREDRTDELEAPETPASPNLGDQVDGPKAECDKESLSAIGRHTEAGGYGGREALPPELGDILEGTDEEEKDEQRNNIENIGPTTEETTELTVPQVTGFLGGSAKCLIVVVLVVIVAILMNPHQSKPPPHKSTVDIFLAQMEKVKTGFPNQRVELWNRSRIHLQRHLQMAQPTAPVSLILTAGIRAERTLRCLAGDLASAFSSALNASVLHIDGASKASQDSDQVKLDIDSKLQGAFEGDKAAAVIHRFEELPPGSTLIFYRYCDHENAAYKRTFLIFTVLLEEEEEIPAKIHLNAVEEMVDDHLQKKFLSHGHPVSFDRMDLDKYGGLWSRISHLILPVAAEERIEHEGCKGT